MNNKAEKYELTQIPRDKLMHLQCGNPFGKMIYDYLENDNLPNETKMAKRISIVAEQFVIKEGILYHIEIPHGAVARDIFRVSWEILINHL